MYLHIQLKYDLGKEFVQNCTVLQKLQKMQFLQIFGEELTVPGIGLEG